MAGSLPNSSPRTTGPGLRRASLLAAVLLAVALPRAAALHGVRYTSALDFADAAEHLFNADRVARLARLGHKQLAAPYFKDHPEQLSTFFPDQWPLLVYRITALWIGELGVLSIWTVQIGNLLFLFILLASLVLLGRAMASWEAGLWAALLATLCPPLAAASWYYTLDLPLCAMCLMGLALLHRTRAFSGTRATLAFAVWSGLGLAVKLTYALYLLPPCLAALLLPLLPRSPWRPLPGSGATGGLAWLRAGGGALLSVAIAFALQGFAPGRVLDLLWEHMAGVQLSDVALGPWSLPWVLSVPGFAAAGLPWPLLLLALPGLALLHLPRSRGGGAPGAWLLLAYLWGNAILLTLMLNKMERYLLPLYPVLCLAAALWAHRWLQGRRRGAALALQAAAFAAVLAASHYRPPPWFPLDEEREYPPQSVLHRFWYENLLPSRGELDRLRRFGFSDACDLAPITRLAVPWLAGSSGEPLALTYLSGAAPHPERDQGPLRQYDFILAVAHQVRDRPLVVKNLISRPDMLTGDLAGAPRLLLVAPLWVEIARENPMIRVERRQTVTLRCQGREHHYQLALAHGG